MVWSSRELHGFRGAEPNQKALGHCGLAQRLQRLNRRCGLPPNRKARRLYASVWKARQAARPLRRWIERKPDTLRLDLEGATRLTAYCALNFFPPSPRSVLVATITGRESGGRAQLHVALPWEVGSSAKEWSAPLFFCWLEGLHGAGRLNESPGAATIGCCRGAQKLNIPTELVYSQAPKFSCLFSSPEPT